MDSTNSSIAQRGRIFPPYVELQVTSNYSFLRGGSHPEELVSEAARLGTTGIAITDHNTLAGIVRAYRVAKELPLQFIVGARLDILFANNNSTELEKLQSSTSIRQDSRSGLTQSVLAYPISRKGYANLCKLLTIGKTRAKKGECILALDDLLQYQQDLALSLAAPTLLETPSSSSHFNIERFLKFADNLISNFSRPKLLSFIVSNNYRSQNKRYTEEVLKLGKKWNIAPVVTNDVYYHVASRKKLQDVLTCIREHCTIKSAGFRLLQNSERHLKSPAEMYRLFSHLPYALKRTLEIAEMAQGFSLSHLKYEYPNEICPGGMSPTQYLKMITILGIENRYPHGVPTKVLSLINAELRLIEELDYEKYFLTCYDIVQFAQSQGILCQGRGAAANSAVCYALGITAVDPAQIDTLFARFISKERNEPPDIDIDFEHERREEVIQYIYKKYGRERAGLVAEVVSYRARSAVREVAKVFGIDQDTVNRLAKSTHRWNGYQLVREELKNNGVDIEDKRVEFVMQLSKELQGFPRHLSQHVGGFIISEELLSETVPIMNAAMPERTTVEWDKDDVEELGLLKIDVLGLGMLSCIRKALELVNARRLEESKSQLELYSIPREDPLVYQMISEADTIGVFQIESRAQMSMLPRLRPQCFYDLVIEVAIVRPGPIQGKMVHPYLKRRSGLEPTIYPDERVEDILGKTLGVPIFQEQAMRLAIVLADFTPGEAEKLRRAIAAWKTQGEVIASLKERVLDGMLANGYSVGFAESCFNQIRSFGEYGFPESHAASFANLVYVSAWLKKHYPAEFTVALLNSQPMGFYQPAQIVSDAKRHKIAVLPIDINASRWDHQIENGGVRIGFRLLRGIHKSQIEFLVTTRDSCGHFRSIIECWSASHRIQSGILQKSTLVLLAKGGAFDSLGKTSRDALWEIRALPHIPAPMDKSSGFLKIRQVELPLQSKREAVSQDFATTGLSLKAHPLELVRRDLDQRNIVPIAALLSVSGKPVNSFVSVAGMVIIKQRPGTAKGFTFITIEDESGITNLIINPRKAEEYQPIVVSSLYLVASGKLERLGEVTYVNVTKLERL